MGSKNDEIIFGEINNEEGIWWFGIQTPPWFQPSHAREIRLEIIHQSRCYSDKSSQS